MMIVQDLEMPKGKGLTWIDDKDHYTKRMDLPKSKEIIQNSKAIKTIGCKVSPITLIFLSFFRKEALIYYSFCSMKVAQQTEDGNSCGFFTAESIHIICSKPQNYLTNESIINFSSTALTSQVKMDEKRETHSRLYEE
jgi:hypothetical protein